MIYFGLALCLGCPFRRPEREEQTSSPATPVPRVPVMGLSVRCSRRESLADTVGSGFGPVSEAAGQRCPLTGLLGDCTLRETVFGNVEQLLRGVLRHRSDVMKKPISPVDNSDAEYKAVARAAPVGIPASSWER